MSNFLKSDYKRQSSISLPDISKTKALEDLDMMDSFLFEEITELPEGAKFIANIIIKRATGHSVDHLIIESEKQLKGILLNNRGIRMDILATEKTVKRLCASTISTPTNTIFNELPDSISIWILPYDPFGDDRMLYTVKNMVVENNHLAYNDGNKPLLKMQ